MKGEHMKPIIKNLADFKPSSENFISVRKKELRNVPWTVKDVYMAKLQAVLTTFVVGMVALMAAYTANRIGGDMQKSIYSLILLFPLFHETAKKWAEFETAKLLATGIKIFYIDFLPDCPLPFLNSFVGAPPQGTELWKEESQRLKIFGNLCHIVAVCSFLILYSIGVKLGVDGFLKLSVLPTSVFIYWMEQGFHFRMDSAKAMNLSEEH
jgi:hypothetical protein